MSCCLRSLGRSCAASGPEANVTDWFDSLRLRESLRPLRVFAIFARNSVKTARRLLPFNIIAGRKSSARCQLALSAASASATDAIARATDAIARATEAIARATEAIARATEAIARATEAIARGHRSHCACHRSHCACHRSGVPQHNPYCLNYLVKKGSNRAHQGRISLVFGGNNSHRPKIEAPVYPREYW
jgi:hypothetical protein